MKPGFFKQLCEIAGKENVRTDEPMKQHTTFRIGGAADYFVSPQTADQIKNIIDLCKSEAMPWYVIGNGSNLLVSDRGFRGVIIQLFKNFSDLRVEGDRLYVQAGTLLSRTAKKALEASLTGFEFAAGIPGTIGGAMVMNAGAYGGEMKDVTEEVTVLTEKGEIKTLKREELKMGYRTSIIAEKGYLVLEAVLQLTDGDLKEIRAVTDFQTAAGISECRKYVQTSERILCRKADHGCRTSRISGRRCTGIGKTLRFCDQYRRCNGRRCH